ncbi:MAG: hypothetical protein IH606_07080 [Burkholderiales bacterium]|nr:hypothetical protein [Burkholderiales bacterium]
MEYIGVKRGCIGFGGAFQLQVEIGGRVLNSVVVGRKAAKKNHEGAFASGITGVMLEVIEPRVFTITVGNILP